MARQVARGEIWTYRFKAPDKRRPVLVLTRSEVIPLLQTVEQARLTRFVGTLSPAKLRDVCQALAIATGCL